MEFRVRARTAGRVASAVLPAVLLLASCTLPGAPVDAQNGRVDDLEARLLRVQRSVDELRAGPAASSGDPEVKQRVADLGQRLEEVAAQVRALSGRVEEVERTARAAPAESPRVGTLEGSLAELSRRVAELEKRPVAAPAPVPSPPPVPAAPPPAPGPQVSSQELYDKAYGLYKQGRYDDAREGFRRYVELHPDTPLTDNALFWMGETYYDQGRYEQAILEYDKVVQKFPNGDKVASALLKQAFAFDAIGDPVDARILLKKIVRDHPATEQAGIARKKLEILGE